MASLNLQDKWNGIPHWVLILGGTTVLVAGYKFYKNYQSAKVSNAANNSAGNATNMLGAGSAAPLIIGEGGGQFGGSPPPSVAPAGGGQPVTFAYGNQLQYFANENGALVHRWTDVQGHWLTEILAPIGTLLPGTSPAVTQNAFGQSGRIDVTAEGVSGDVHGWYTPQQRKWGVETLPSVTSGTPGTTVSAGIPAPVGVKYASVGGSGNG